MGGWPEEKKESTVEAKATPDTAKAVPVEDVPIVYINCPKCGETIYEEFFVQNKVATTKLTLEKEKLAKGYTARSDETGDKVYLVKDNTRYWIKNPETLAKLGFTLGQEKNIPFS